VLSKAHAQKSALLATQIVCEGSAFFRNLILARLVGADEMGVAVALALAIRLFEMTAEFGLDRLLMQVEAPSLPTIRKTVNFLQIAKGAGVTVAALMLATPITAAINGAISPSIFAFAALSIFLRSLANWDFRERQRYGDYVPGLLVEGASAAAAVIIAIPITLLIADYTALAWILVAHATFFLVLSHLVASTRYSLGIDRQGIARCMRYGIPVAVNGALMFLAFQGDRLIVALNFSASDLARFALASQLALLPSLIGVRYLLASELPRLSRLSREAGMLGSYCASLMGKVFVVAVVGAATIGLLGNGFVIALYGSEFQLDGAVFWCFGAWAGLRLIRAVPTTAIMAIEKTQLVLLCSLPRIGSLVAAFWWAGHGGGLVGIAFLAVLGEAACLVTTLVAFVSCSGIGLEKRFTRVAESPR